MAGKVVPDDRCLRERSSGGPSLWFLLSVKEEEIILAAQGNEALVQNGLLFKFFMVGLGVVG